MPQHIIAAAVRDSLERSMGFPFYEYEIAEAAQAVLVALEANGYQVVKVDPSSLAILMGRTNP